MLTPSRHANVQQWHNTGRRRRPARTLWAANGRVLERKDSPVYEKSWVMFPDMVRKVACIGAGFVGAPLGAVIAYKCPGLQVIVVDKDKKLIEAWNSRSLPLYEAQLNEIVSVARERTTRFGQNGLGQADDMNDVDLLCGYPDHAPSLRFSTDIEAAVKEAEMIFLCVNTPTKRFGVGRGMAADLSNLQAAVRMIAEVATSDKIVVEKSTVPCGTADMIRDLLRANARKGVNFEVLSNPEFLSEGTAVQDLLYPSRVLIGSKQNATGQHAAESLSDIYERWVPREKIITMDLWSSELSKLAANAMLAQRLSSINSLSAICEAVGADIDSVSYACGLDHRIGKDMLKSSLGWGGGCFRKDVLDLVYIARSLHLDKVADYWASVVDMNEDQKARFLHRVISCMHGNVTGKKIAVLGFAFKKNTSDTKESAAISLVKGLLAEEAIISIYDPMVKEDRVFDALRMAVVESRKLGDMARVYQSAYDACDYADAVIVATEWDELRTPTTFAHDNRQESPERAAPQPISPCMTPDSDENMFSLDNPPKETSLDWGRITRRMKEPKFVFDGRNLLDGNYLRGLGCRYVAVGKASGWDTFHTM
ncbi:hypothetical protein VTN00DRAFT_8164 [Thermoascus crustaceus]|uniref:uncharacterized protein n=1 Tax=Thermoascus crustaceus TaxID=5088 RepID=UPI003744AC21